MRPKVGDSSEISDSDQSGALPSAGRASSWFSVLMSSLVLLVIVFEAADVAPERDRDVVGGPEDLLAGFLCASRTLLACCSRAVLSAFRSSRLSQARVVRAKLQQASGCSMQIITTLPGFASSRLSHGRNSSMVGSVGAIMSAFPFPAPVLANSPSRPRCVGQ